MNALLAISIVSGALALMLFARTGRCVRHRRILRAGGSCLSGCVAAAFCGAAVVLIVTLRTYGQLTEEQLVSHIEFRSIAAQEFEARLMIAGEEDRVFVLAGDEWQMDARIVSWKPPMTILGLDPLFQLDRLSGRYSEIDREMTDARTVHSLANERPVDIWRAARRFPLFVPGVDAYYGTATYVPMADGARYSVSISRDALIARPANKPARDALGGWPRGE